MGPFRIGRRSGQSLSRVQAWRWRHGPNISRSATNEEEKEEDGKRFE
jgi:hypothetical protein